MYTVRMNNRGKRKDLGQTQKNLGMAGAETVGDHSEIKQRTPGSRDKFKFQCTLNLFTKSFGK